MSDEKSKKTEITKIITPETESSKTTDKEKTSAIDTSPIEVQVENSAEESINNETNDLKKIEETTEVETKVEDNIIVSEDIEK
ncbi:MAG: hypothetical protein ACI884_002412, partial [Ulvibacter sp.]